MSLTKRKIIICLLSAMMIVSSIVAVFIVGANEASQRNSETANQESAQVLSIFKNVQGCTFEAEFKSPEETMLEYKGVKVTSNPGEKMQFRYNGIFDLSKKEKFIDFLVLPQKMGTCDIDNITITLTDVHDEDKYLTIFFFDGATFANELMNSYMRCSESGKYKGLGYNWSGIPNETGTSSQISFRGHVPAAGGDWKSIGLYFDTDNSELRMRRSDYNTNRTWITEFDYMVWDYLDPILADNKFSGFSTNEVYVDVEVQALGGAKASLLVMEFAGIDTSTNKISQDKGNMTFDLQGYDSTNLPYGVAGENSTYPIFDALAYSPMSGVKKVNDVKVFYGPEQVSIKDGRFATKKAGFYQIVYNVTLSNGQKVQKTLDVFVKDAYEKEINYIFDSKIPSQVSFGVDKVYLYEGVAEGGSGDLTIERTLLLDGKEVNLHKEGLYEYFVPQVIQGNNSVYQLKYDITDITGVTKTFVKDINVVIPNTPVILEVSMPKAVRVGSAMTLPMAIAYSIDEAGNKSNVPVTLKVDGQENNGVYVPSKAGSFTVSYHAGESTAEYQVQAIAKPTEENYNNWYFSPSGFSSGEVERTGIWFTANGQRPMLDYAAPLCADNFSVGFSVSLGQVSAVRVTITDILNANEKVEFDIRQTSDSPKIFVQGEEIGRLPGSFVSEGRQDISFNLYKSKIQNGVDTLGVIEYYANGEKFNGFSSKSIYFNIELIEYEENAKLKMAMLNGQSFISIADDLTAPILNLNNDISLIRSVDVGSEVCISGANAWDVFGNIEELKVEISFTDIDGNTTLVYEGDISEDYYVSGDTVGTYNVYYYAYDDSYNITEKYSVIYVVDTEKPTITSTLNLNDKYNVGDKISLPKIKAEDDSGAVKTYYMIIVPNGEWVVLFENNGAYEYTFKIKGTHKVCMVAMDTAMNMTRVDYELIVR